MISSISSYLFFLLTMINICRSSSSSTYEESPLQNVTAVMEDKVLLPCDISTELDDDQANMIMFYRNNSGTPIYTVDLRSRRKSPPKHQIIMMLHNRSEFSLKLGKSGLIIRNVWSSDDGLYRCRVDFKKSPTRNSRIYLTVIVPPDSVRILDQTGAEKSSMIGPFILGQTLDLTCVARGGRPLPKLSWWADNKPAAGTSRVVGNEVFNTLSIPSLQRHHLQQSFICQASNDKNAVPVTAAVTVEMRLPPMTVTIRGIHGPISAGVSVTVTCEVTGARPSPAITWWLDGRPLTSLRERVHDLGNITESTVNLQVSKEDKGRHLTCRAQTPELLQSEVENDVKLEVQYAPVVRISVDPQLNVENIQEGDNIYLSCSIDSVPRPTFVNWYHNEVLLNPNSSVGVIVSNESLVIQKANRYSSGNYVCKARNEEGLGVSRPVGIKVKFAPTCSPKQRLVYGAARGELTRVYCQVEAHPPQVFFEWHFNNSREMKQISDSHITNNWTASTLTYTPSSEDDYGLLACSASNSVGRQLDPCIYKIFPAGPPDTLKNCSVINESLDSVEVHCVEGFDGGIPQSFIMEVFETREKKLKSNVTSKSASFTVRGLPSGLPLTIRLYAANPKGKSPVSVLKASTLTDRAEKHTSGVLQASELPSTMELYPSLTIFLGVIGGILIVFIVIVVVMVVRRPRRVPARPSIQQDDSSLHILKKEDSNSGRLDGDEKDPDIIPEARGNRGDSCDRYVSDVSTIFGELVTQTSPPNTHAHIHHHQEPSQGIQLQQQQSQHPRPNMSQMPTSMSSSNNHYELNSPPPPTEFQNKPNLNIRHHNHVHNQHQQQQHLQRRQLQPSNHLGQHQQSNHHLGEHQQNNNLGQHQQPNHLGQNQQPNHMGQHLQQSNHIGQHQPSTVVSYAHPSAHPSAIPPSYTQTLPHPRSNHGRNHQFSVTSQKSKENNPHHATLTRRGSLYMDPYIQPLSTAPLAPPPPYNAQERPELGAVVSMVAETVRITPNCGAPVGGLMSPPDHFPPKPFPSSFGSEKDRMESSV